MDGKTLNFRELTLKGDSASCTWEVTWQPYLVRLHRLQWMAFSLWYAWKWLTHS